MSDAARSDQVSGNALSVSLVKPPEVGFADWISRLREWLDHQGIEPTGFKYTVGAWGSHLCEVTFRDRTQADLFAAEFHQKNLP